MNAAAQAATAREALVGDRTDSRGGTGNGGGDVGLERRLAVKPGEPAMSGTSEQGAAAEAAGRRILLVEDEFLIRMLLEDMLDELGYAVAATAGRVEEAAGMAKSGEYDLAILDVNLDGEDVYPVAEILAQRGVPFLFVTGYGGRGLPEPYRNRPTLQKPFQIEDLSRTLGAFFGSAA
jgi:CheY-like chemotaxis protein